VAAGIDAPYLPRSELSAAPKLLDPVNVGFPEGVRGLVRLQVQASLFIDEDGVVRRVRVETAGVHPSFERAILEAFSSARFIPGQVGDAAVRSQIKVEVEFNSPSGAGR
jgi:TonB family protein